ncbi:MAG: hypothetical protein MJK08_05470 [Campylobacterales bacterium]|nr:hypothetical protein [Campylobacterales bacterium]
MLQNFSKDELKTIKLSKKVFEEIISKAEKVDLIYLSFNTSLSELMIIKLFSYNIDNVNINLLRNKNTPLHIIENFLSLNDKIYNITIAHNENITLSVQNKLKELNDIDVNNSMEYTKYLISQKSNT